MMKLIENKNDKMNFALFYPNIINKDDKLPLIIYLHGAGERGTNLNNVYRHAIPRLLKEGKEINAYVLCPQCPANCVWDNIVFKVKGLIDDIVDKYNIDKSKISLTGSSMGGFGTYAMAFTFNNFFSCIAPVAGGGTSWRVSNLNNLSIKIYHGDKDTGVPLEYANLMYDVLKYTNPSTKLVVMEGYGHSDGIEHCYEDLDIIDYLLSNTNKGKQINPEFLHEMFD